MNKKHLISAKNYLIIIAIIGEFRLKPISFMPHNAAGSNANNS